MKKNPKGYTIRKRRDCARYELIVRDKAFGRYYGGLHTSLQAAEDHYRQAWVGESTTGTPEPNGGTSHTVSFTTPPIADGPTYKYIEKFLNVDAPPKPGRTYRYIAYTDIIEKPEE